jgi:hypothetical protein
MVSEVDKFYGCDQCGRAIAKVHRRYQGESYCTTCYYREFKLRQCPDCGQNARLNRKHPQAVCQKCETARKPCIRCGKTDFSIGRRTPDGPVCNSCSVHYRDPKKCNYCGETSKYLSRDASIGFDKPACQKCRRRHFGTCSVCRRHRVLEQTIDGSKQCSKCLEQSFIQCAVCNEPMPAGYGNRCETCSLKQRLIKIAQLNCQKLSKLDMASLYQEFSEWLEKRVGLRKAVSSLSRYVKFFIEIESMEFESIDYQKLVSKFSAASLRRWIIPVEFLLKKLDLSVINDEKIEDSESRQIARLLNQLPIRSHLRSVLDHYHNHLLNRKESGQSTIRSVRLAIKPALALLQSIGSKEIPNQCDLDAYLRRKPGQRAAISGFVRFLKDQYGVEWALPRHIKKSKFYSKKDAELRLIQLLQNPASSTIYQKRLLRAKLLYFHGVEIKANNIKLETTIVDDHYCVINIDGNPYFLPR